MANTDIQWTNKTWNPIAGCSEISPACEFCYAKYMAHRLAHMAHTAKKYEGTTRRTQGGKTQWTGKIKFDEEALLLPLKWKKGVKIFVNSMSDLFHDNVPFEDIDKVFAVMSMRKQHTFQVLTKRPERMREYTNSLKERVDYILSYIAEIGGTAEQVAYAKEHIEQNGFLPNVWLGCTVENQETANERIPHLLACPAKVRFLSCEPLLGAIDLTKIVVAPSKGWEFAYIDVLLGRRWEYAQSVGYADSRTAKIDWVIAGGESGKKSRVTKIEWFRSMRDQCANAGTAFLFKQFGEFLPECQATEEHKANFVEKGSQRVKVVDKHIYYKVGSKVSGNTLDGKQHLEFPKV